MLRWKMDDLEQGEWGPETMKDRCLAQLYDTAAGAFCNP